ncbi:ferrochelatase [Bacteriovoracaceae bacterium]|nr:ferrochelatase [Bacteriovoracaceae bacterium]
MARKSKVILAQLGSPKSPKVSDVRIFLKRFLGDPRVVDINPFLWKVILNCFVLPFRPKKSAKAYKRIWSGNSFPLITNTEDFANAVSKHTAKNIEVNHCFLVSYPEVSDLLDQWQKQDWKERAQKVLVIPQFPQYSESTIASVFDAIGEAIKGQVNIPEITFVDHYHNSKAFIDNSVIQINKALSENSSDDLIISFHGIPLRRVLYKKDVYYRHCYETYFLIKQGVVGVAADNIHFTFQSRFGSEQWLGPSTDEYAISLAKAGSKNIAVYCPSFVVDCLETTDEIGTELGEELAAVSCQLNFIACLNDDEKWSQDFANFINVYVNGNLAEKEQLFYETDNNYIEANIPEQVMQSPPLSNEAKSSLNIIFLTLFLDLIGFSIIFPMFPALAKYYLTVDAANPILKMIFGGITNITNLTAESTGMSPIVLFGGALGALYSLLQFVAAPFWGSLSDKIGRKPVLLVSVFGLFLSYVLWVFSGSFTVLIIARILGGLMGGNISTASAVVADVTQRANRSKGMAFVGIAFAMGFIFGPAIGGVLSLVDLTKIYPGLTSMGINPFSVPALFAAVLSFINLIYVYTKFEETLPTEKRGKGELYRTANILSLFKPLPYRNLNLTNWAYFIFIAAFSGMEFTLTFLAVERLSYTSMDNAKMFLWIGFILAMVQGGYVRRKAHTVGEKRMAIQGFLSVIPGLVIIGFCNSTLTLYLGLLFLAVGSAMAIPTLTSLISLHAPESEQGRALGIFRSLGSLGRVIGPISASLVYWKYGSTVPYLAGALSMLIPVLVLKMVEAINSALDCPASV